MVHPHKVCISALLQSHFLTVKNPQADLTWQKGCKRQLANLERFIEELLVFEEEDMSEVTLSLVEPYLKKSSLDAAGMVVKTGIEATGTLCQWVHLVCRYV